MPSHTLKRISSSNSELVASKTKQLVYYQGTVCAVSRSRLKSTNATDQKAVGRLFGTQINKRHAHGAQVTCLEDRLNFKKVKMFAKAPFRNWVLYSEIEHYFVFPEHPHMFMLAIKSNIPDQSYFETYKCKTKEEAELLCELICNACRDPEKKLHKGVTGITPYSALSEVSIHSNAISHPNLASGATDIYHDTEENGLLTTSSETNKEHDEPEIEEIRMMGVVTSSPAPPMNSSSPALFPEIDDMVLAECPRDETQMETTEAPIEATLSDREMYEKREEKVNEEISVDDYLNDFAEIEKEYEDKHGGMTYFDYHPKLGAVLNDEGPIYMFLKRYECTTGQECA